MSGDQQGSAYNYEDLLYQKYQLNPAKQELTHCQDPCYI